MATIRQAFTEAVERGKLSKGQRTVENGHGLGKIRGYLGMPTDFGNSEV